MPPRGSQVYRCGVNSTLVLAQHADRHRDGIVGGHTSRRTSMGFSLQLTPADITFGREVRRPSGGTMPPWVSSPRSWRATAMNSMPGWPRPRADARRRGDRAGNLRREPAHPRASPTASPRQGYVTIAPCLFDRIRRGIELGYSEKETQEGRGYRLQIPKEKTLVDLTASHQRDQTRGPRGDGRILLGRHARLPRRLRAAGVLRRVVLRRADQGSPREIAAAPGDVSLRREGSVHSA